MNQEFKVWEGDVPTIRNATPRIIHTKESKDLYKRYISGLKRLDVGIVGPYEPPVVYQEDTESKEDLPPTEGSE